MVKPRFAFTVDQSVMVDGVPGPADGVVVAVDVLEGVAVPVALAVGLGVGVKAPSSRKTIKGFVHQLILFKAVVEGVGVGDPVLPKRPEHALKSSHTRRKAAIR